MTIFSKHKFRHARFIHDERDIVMGLFHTPLPNVNITVAGVILTAPMDLPPTQVAVKRYGAAEGVEKDLLDAGILVGGPLHFVKSGFVTMPVYNLSRDAVAMVEAMLNAVAVLRGRGMM